MAHLVHYSLEDLFGVTLPCTNEKLHIGLRMQSSGSIPQL